MSSSRLRLSPARGETGVNRRLLDEAERIPERIVGIKGVLAPRSHLRLRDDPAADLARSCKRLLEIGDSEIHVSGVRMLCTVTFDGGIHACEDRVAAVEVVATVADPDRLGADESLVRGDGRFPWATPEVR